ncbi:uncharacterized protein METZ01_LOCUS353498, partial [marine metagenome]
HWDANPDDDFFFNCLKNSSEQYKNEIYDIFFGATFLHRDVTYGDVMGVNASEGQYKNLLKIQEKYGIPISLTLNSMDRPIQMIRHDIIKEFVSYIKKYYDDGVRSCTISHTHLMKTGALQEAFPDMDWKNTVNHGIKSTQEMLDYAALGYTTIQLDRKFNRSYAALKRTKKEADRIGVKTCLLIKEYCMPECPFKQEHDCWSGGSSFREIGTDYWETIPFTCNTWRPIRIGGEQKEKDIEVINPRTGTDMMVHSKDDWDEFASIVDIFKLSGRLNNHNPTTTQQKLAYYFEMQKPEVTSADESTVTTNMMMVDSFKEV